MLARRGRVCGRRSCLWRAATELLHVSASRNATFHTLKASHFTSLRLAPCSFSTLSTSPLPFQTPFGARSLSQNLISPHYDEEEENHDTDNMKVPQELKLPRDTRLITLERLEDEYLTRLTEAMETSDGSAAWRTALDIFDEIQHANGRGLALGVASFLVEVLGSRRRVQDCMRVLAFAREQGIRPRIQSYSCAIGCCYKEEQYAHALRVFEVMRNDGYVPQLVTYSHGLSAALKSGQHELVLEIFDDMIKNRLDLNIIIYNNILNSCARAADVQSAFGVLRAIRQRRLEMTQATYHSLAICAGKTGQWELALDAMATMKEEGFEPTSTIYNSVFSACAKGKQWDTVVEVYEAMPEDLRESLRGVYLGAVIMGHAKAEDDKVKLRGLEIFHKYKSRSKEEQPNFFAYNAALIALLETNQLEEMHPLANDIKKQGMKWDTVTYQCLILSYIRGGAVETGVQMLQKNAKRMGKTTMCYREAIQFYEEKRKNPREAVRLTMQMMQVNKRLSRLDWHNALRIALQLPERAPYWNFRKWMGIRAKGIVQDVPPHLMLPTHADQRMLLQGDTPSDEQPEKKHYQDNYHSRKRQLNRRKSEFDEEKFLWIDCLDTDRTVVYNRGPEYIYGGTSANGMCAGYMKDYVGRGDGDINNKMTFKILIADVTKSAAVCTADAWDYSGWRTRLSLTAGSTFYFGYTSNGHIVKEQAAGKTFYGVYWTGVPGTSLPTTSDLTSDKLMDGQLHNFDDGNCGEAFTDEAQTIPSGRAGDGYPCVGTFTMPAGTAAGVYNLVWFWKFYDADTNTSIPTSSGTYGGAAYTSCFQVEVTA
uniref:Pentacotripeptide-repeat region of PRORP domain-containing protein n=2 Tax=Phytophthora ramorum TaxID=164328 RepID=H3H407_PHYRM